MPMRTSAQTSAPDTMIDRIDFECRLELCNNLLKKDALRNVTGLWVGLSFRDELLPLAQERLLATRYFSRVDITKTYEGSDLVITIETTAQPFVSELELLNYDPLDRAEIKRSLNLREGLPLGSFDACRRQERSLENIYRKEGFAEARVRIVATPDEIPSAIQENPDFLPSLGCQGGGRDEQAEQEAAWNRVLEHCDSFYRKKEQLLPDADEEDREIPCRVQLSVEIEPGPSLSLGNIYVWRENPNDILFDYDTIVDTIVDEFGFFDSRYTEQRISDGIDALVKDYRDAGHIEARVTLIHEHRDRERGAVDVFVRVNESAKWTVEIEGNTFYTRDEIEAVLPFKDAGYIQLPELETAKEEILSLYRTTGHFWAKVEAKRNVDTHTARLIIEEGPVARVTRIEMDGNTRVSDNELIATMETGQGGTFGPIAYLQLPQLADDIERLISFYQSRGFLNAHIPQWRIETNPERTEISIIITVEEGRQTTIDALEVDSDVDLIDKKKLADPNTGKRLGQGSPFYPPALRNALKRLQGPFSRNGYAQVQATLRCKAVAGKVSTTGLSPRDRTLQIADLTLGLMIERDACTIPRLPDGCLPANPSELCKPPEDDPNSSNLVCSRTYLTANDNPEGSACLPYGGMQADTVAVDFYISAGRYFKFGDIFLQGNTETRDWVILGGFKMQKGDDFNRLRILEAKQTLRNRGIFDATRVEPIGITDTSDPNLQLTSVPLLVAVSEAQSADFIGSALFSFSLEDSRFSLDAEVIERNLAGTGFKLNVFSNIEIDVNEFEIGEFFRDGGACPCNTISIFTLAFPFYVELFNEESLAELLFEMFYDLQLIPSTELEVTGGVAEIRLPFFDNNAFMSFGVEVKTSASRSQAEAFRISTDIFDNRRLFEPRLATASGIARLRIEGRDNPLNPTEGGQLDARIKVAFGFLNNPRSFIKLDIQGSWIFNLPLKFLLVLNGRFGAAIRDDQLGLSDSAQPLQSDERFRLGGISSLRGYPQDAVGPHVRGEPIGGETLVQLNTELRFPIFGDFQGAIFVDAGELLESVEQLFTTQDFRVSAGIGLRYMLAGLFPLVIDYAIILNRKTGEAFGGPQFNIGFQF